MNTKKACDVIRKFPDLIEKVHFGSDAFSANGRIFATVWHDKGEVNLRLSPEQQEHFLLLDGEGFVEIDNAWGRQGWTKVQLGYVDQTDFEKVVKSAYEYSKKKQQRKTKMNKKKL
jgi:hypothetical protein